MVDAWLQQRFVPALIDRVNSVDVRRRIGLYGGDRVPENERNLTDVRNRVSLILEYEVARVTNDLLAEAGVSDLFVSYVVANRFPDLEVRRRDGRRGVRLEIKALQTIAEEKAANFDTLKKDLHPATDFLLVWLWEWHTDPGDTAWDRAPRVHAAYVFNAAALAHLRDWRWLHKPPPPASLGGGYQGFDLRHAVTCSRGVYSEEEGNYGKLLRIWEDGFSPPPSWAALPLLLPTANRYLEFKEQAIRLGFDHLANRELRELAGAAEASVALRDARGATVWVAGRYAFALGEAPSLPAAEAERARGVRTLVVLTRAYAWKAWACGRGLAPVELLVEGRKPKLIRRLLAGSPGSGTGRASAR